MNHNAASYLIERHILAGHGARTAIVTDAESISYSALAQAVDQAATYLGDHLGVLPRDRIVLHLPDSPEFVYFFLAALKLGAVAVPINTFGTPAALAFQLHDTRARVLVSHSTLLPNRTAAPQPLSTFLEHVVHADQPAWRVADRPITALNVAADHSAFWLYTSGSTGSPKAAIHRHAGIPACANNFGRDVLALAADDRCYSASKLFFAYGLGNSLLLPLAVGASTVLNPTRSDADTVLRTVRERAPTVFFAVPTLYRQLLSSPLFDSSAFAAVRMFISAGEPLPAPLFYEWLERTGQPLYDGIGSTEAMHIFCANRPGKYRAATSGVPVEGYDLCIVDDGGNEVATDQPGQLWVRGATIAQGYWNREEATQATFRDDWLITGDIYRRSADGYYHYLGRKGDVFKCHGQWVAPLEVESALLGCASVQEAAVIAANDAEGFTVVKAYVVPAHPLRAADEEALRHSIRSQLRAGLPSYKIPSLIDFLTELPKTSTGKVSRLELRRNHSSSQQLVARCPLSAAAPPHAPRRAPLNGQVQPYPATETQFATPLQLAEGVYQLRMPLPFRLDHINLYLLEDASGWTLVDCGLNRPEVMELWLGVLDGFLRGKPLERIVVTHLHPDHIGLAGWLQERTGVPIYLTRGEWQLAQQVFNLTTTNPELIEAHYRRLGLQDAALNTTARQASGYRRLVKALPSSVRHLHEHEVLDLGGRGWRILFGAGHSPACACLWDEASGMLIAGDHVLPDITSNVNLMTVGPRNPLDDYLTSLQTFRELPCRQLLPAHGAATARYHERIDELLQHHEQRLQLLRQACGEQPRTAAECVPLLFDKTLPDDQYFFAIGEAAAHLVYLQEHGQLTRDGETTWRFRQ